MGSPKMLQAINQVVFNQYIEHIKSAGLFRITLYKHFNGAGIPDPAHKKSFIMIKDLEKWCSMNRFDMLN